MGDQYRTPLSSLPITPSLSTATVASSTQSFLSRLLDALLSSIQGAFSTLLLRYHLLRCSSFWMDVNLCANPSVEIRGQRRWKLTLLEFLPVGYVNFILLRRLLLRLLVVDWSCACSRGSLSAEVKMPDGTRKYLFRRPFWL
jgi:hypothetical protein